MTTTTTKPTLYYMLESAHCRTVLAVTRMLGMQVDLRPLNLLKREQCTEEFAKINPFQSLPTFVDGDGFTVWESPAICTYLLQTRLHKTMLYPLDVSTRTTVDKLVQYNLGTLSRVITDLVFNHATCLSDDATEASVSEAKLDRIRCELRSLERYLATLTSEHHFIADTEYVTLADLSAYFTLTYVVDLFHECPLQVDLSECARVRAFIDRVHTKLGPYNRDGLFDRARNNCKQMAKAIRDQHRQNRSQEREH